MAQTVKHLPTMRETRVQSLGSGRSPREGNGNPLQYSCLENPMDGRALGYSPSGPKELDTTDRLHFHFNKYSPQLNRGRNNCGIRLWAVCPPMLLISSSFCKHQFHCFCFYFSLSHAIYSSLMLPFIQSPHFIEFLCLYFSTNSIIAIHLDVA